jgi:hypothetical protein
MTTKNTGIKRTKGAAKVARLPQFRLVSDQQVYEALQRMKQAGSLDNRIPTQAEISAEIEKAGYAPLEQSIIARAMKRLENRSLIVRKIEVMEISA